MREAIEKRIQRHLEEHKGLYTQEEIQQLIPVWEKNILNQLGLGL